MTDKVIDARERFAEAAARDPHLNAILEARIAMEPLDPLELDAQALTEDDVEVLREIATRATGDARAICATRRLLASSEVAARKLLEQQREIINLRGTLAEVRASFGAAADAAVTTARAYDSASKRAAGACEVARRAIGIIADVEKAVRISGDTSSTELQDALDASQIVEP